MSPYSDNRRRFLNTLAEHGAAAIFATGSEQLRNGDTHYRFRPSSDFWYLTGFAEPEAVLVLAPMAPEEEPRSVLFLREKKRDEEIWTGRRLGTEAAPQALGVDAAYPISELWQRLPSLLEHHPRVVYATGQDEERDRRVLRTFERLRRQARAGHARPFECIDPTLWLHEQRLFKGDGELERMRRAAQLTVEGHLRAMADVRAGMGENELEALLEYTYRKGGSTGPAYPHIVAGGRNACVLHYTENDQPLRDGDLVLIDSGAEFEYYASDVTRTFPVSGRFSDEQRAVYEVVLAAQTAAIEAAAPGVPLDDLHEVALAHLCNGIVELGLVDADPQQCLDDDLFRPFYMHRTSHWLGLDVHDVGEYTEDGDSRALAPGMVLTIEPGLYIDAEDENVAERWRGIGVRIEDDVLVTEQGNEVLTSGAPKTVAEVEAACGAGAGVGVR